MKEYDGIWWLPTDERVQLQGTLTFDNKKGGLLTLSGNFPFPIEFHSLQSKQDFIILGNLSHGKEVTLVAFGMKNFEQKISNHDFESKLILDIKFILLGHQFRTIQSIAFDSMLVQYSNLSKYFSYFDFKHTSQGLSPIEIIIDNSRSMKIVYRDTHVDDLTSIFSPDEKIYTEFQSTNSNKGLDEYLELAFTFLAFLGFTAPYKATLLSLVGKMQSSSGSSPSKHIEVIWRLPDSEVDGPISDKNNIFYKINHDLNTLVKLWFAFKQEFNTVYKYYFAVVDNPGSYLTNKFLMIAGALESYHKIAWENKSKIARDKKTFVAKIKPLIKGAISDNANTKFDWDKVKKLMGDWNKPTLTERLTELLGFYWDIVSSVSIKIGDKECFAQRVTRYRNDAAHGNFVIEEGDYYDLYFTFMDVKNLLYVCILTELNFSNEEIKDLLHVKTLKEVMETKMQMISQFLDPNIMTAYSWSKEVKLPCKLPKTLENHPDQLIKIVQGVEDCFKEELANLNLSKEESEKAQFDFLQRFTRQKKAKVLTKLLGLKKDMRDVQGEYVAAISLALWSGCISSAQMISSEEKGGPSQNLRSHLFVILEKFCSESPIYGKGVELGPLWKLTKNESDVNFDEIAPHWRVRKYENTYYDRISLQHPDGEQPKIKR